MENSCSADSDSEEEMKQDIEATETIQVKENDNSDVSQLMTEIKQEPDDEISEETFSNENVNFEVGKFDSFDEKTLELNKVSQIGLCTEDRENKEDLTDFCKKTCFPFYQCPPTYKCAFRDINAGTLDNFTDSENDVQKIKVESTYIIQQSHLINPDVFSENIPEHVRNSEGRTRDLTEGLERLTDNIRNIVKEESDETEDFDMIHDHKSNTDRTTENMNGELCLTSREYRANDLENAIKVRKCQDMVEDVTGKISPNDDNLAVVSNEDGSKLKSSIDQHTKPKSCKCDICGSGFSNSGSLVRHKRTHTGEKPYKCDFCGVGFTQNSSLNIHKRTHTGERPYKCDFCDLGFTQNSSLISHRRTHTGERPYKCDICDLGFTYASNLRDHKRTHTGERPKKCDVCGVGFTQNSSLNSHRRTHTGEKPHKCDVCDVCFTNASSLMDHRRTHTGEKPYKCEVCGVGFTQNSSLNSHKRTHTGEKPYKCDICGVGFTQNGSLNRHRRTHWKEAV